MIFRQPTHPYVWEVYPKVCNLPQHAESFFMKKRNDEAMMIQNNTARKEETKEEVVESAAALNPDAYAFVPKFTF